MSDTAPGAVRIEGLGKGFSSRPRSWANLLRVMIGWPLAGPHVWALRDVSLDLAPGASLGLVGANGAGKSTLLALMAGLLQPTHGRLACGGSVRALLDPSATLIPELTGRENLELAAVEQGLSGRDAREFVAEAASFADLGDALEREVWGYSAGMRLRLTFAAATSRPCDVLLVDEVIAVGDATFSGRCLPRIRALQRGGTTLVVASHVRYWINELCEQALWLHDGRVRVLGAAPDVTAAWEHYARQDEPGSGRAPVVTANAELLSVSVGAGDDRAATIGVDDDLAIRATFRIEDAKPPLSAIVLVHREDGLPVMMTSSHFRGFHPRLDGDRASACLTFRRLPLLAGRYLVTVGIMDGEFLQPLALVPDCAEFTVVAGDRREQGLVAPDHEWSEPGA